MARTKGKTGPKFNRASRQDVMTNVSTLRRRGYTQAEIATILGVSQRQVSEYLKQIDTWYKSLQVAETTLQRREQVERYNDLLKEAWEAWERSQEDAEKEVTEEAPKITCPTCDGTKIIKGKPHPKYPTQDKPCKKCEGTGQVGGVIKVVKTKEGQVGDPRFLQLLKAIHDSVGDLLGLNLGEKNPGNVVVLNWDQISQAKSGTRQPNPIEEELQRIEAQVVSTADTSSTTPGNESSESSIPGEPAANGAQAKNGHSKNGKGKHS